MGSQQSKLIKRNSQAWIFVSHSTRDLNKVRKVRNAIEFSGGEPILFFLKCLSDHDEIDNLVKREIEARNFFLLCDSHNAKSSKWVQDEIAHVKSLKERKIEIINLDANWKSQINGIRAIIRHATVFLSYAHKDNEVILPIREALIANDFSIWDPMHNLRAGANFARQISSAIEDAGTFGFVIHFLSRNSLKSAWVASEIDIALRVGVGDRYIPILLEPLSVIANLLPETMRERQCLDYSERNLDALIAQLLHVLGVRNTEQPDARDLT